MPSAASYPLFELSPEQFEKLCVELMSSAAGASSAVFADKPRWIDAVIGTVSSAGTKTIAIEVSHRTNFHPLGLNHFFERLAKEERKFDEYVFITSAPLQDAHRQMLNSSSAKALDRPISLLGQQEVIELLDKNPSIATKYFKALRQQVKRRRAVELASVLGLVASVAGLASSFYALRDSPPLEPASFGSQIASVEESLARLKSLESGLRDLKEELRTKSEEAAKVSKEYEEAMKLKALTQEQLEQIKLAVSGQSKTEVFFNYFWGFLLGVAGSVLATIITDRWKQRQALRKPYA